MRIRPALSMALALVLVACGSTQPLRETPDSAPDVDTAYPDSAPDVDTADTSAPVSSEPSVHRASAPTCPADRPASGTAQSSALDSGYATCNVDSDCTAGVNGRCFGNGHDGWSCSYDTCSTDGDCASGELCSCRTSWHYGSVGPNRCLPSNCRVDSDCGPGGFCSPSVDAGCGSYLGVTGWYCHKPGDACMNDDDCAGFDAGLVPGAPPFCGYKQEVGKWACVQAGCVG
jgi:hypothetical protein